MNSDLTAAPDNARAASAPSCGVFDDAEVRAKLVDLSQTFIYNLFDGEGDACAALFSEGAIWLGPLGTQKDYTIEGFRRSAALIKRQGLRVIIAHLGFKIVPQDCENCHVIATAVCYLGAQTASKVTRRALRASFHWRLFEHARVRLAGLEIAFPFEAEGDIVASDASTSADASKDAWTRRIELRDSLGATHFVDEDKIIFVEAKGRKTLVRTLEGDIEVPEGIGAIEGRFGDRFIRLHRTYLVNGWFVRSLSSSGAVMVDGSVLPVPSRRFVTLRQAVADVRKPRQLTLEDLESALRGAIERRRAADG